MSENPLGKDIPYRFRLNPDVLFPIAREQNRAALGLTGREFYGYDIWNAYELSWLNPRGKPEIRILRLIYSADSPFIVESKSFKLYLNGFAMTPFKSEEDVRRQIEGDLTQRLQSSFLKVELYAADTPAYAPRPVREALLLDTLDITTDAYTPDPELLQLAPESKRLHGQAIERFSNLFKANCPITGQPDWASLYVKYKADRPLQDASLLRYIISYRDHAGFHESCCEQIFRDLNAVLMPDVLIVKCFFTRRGGIDINPIRSKGECVKPGKIFRLFRQ